MANISITQLPTAQTLTGAELVPVVQNGTTVQTTTGAIASSPVLTQTFLTVGTQAGLANSRAFTVSSGLAITDGGPASLYTVALTGAPLSLVTSGYGFQVKTAIGTLVNRLITVGSGLSITNADGIASNPSISYSGIMSNFAATTGTGLLAVSGVLVTPITITGAATQISVVNGNASGGNPVIGLPTNVIFPGVGAVAVPVGSTAQRPTPVIGQIRYSTDANSFEGYSSLGWSLFAANPGGVASISFGTTGLTPVIATSGSVTVSGVLAVANGGTNSTAMATAGGSAYGTGTSFAFTATGTAGQVLTSTGATAPVWSGVSGGTY